MPRLVSSTLYVSISVSLSIAQQARRVCAQKLERRSSHDLSTTNCPFPMLSCGPCAALKCLLQSCKQSVLNVVLYWNGAHGTRSHRIFLTRLMICPCSNASISAQLPMPVIIIQIYERVWKHVLVRADLEVFPRSVQRYTPMWSEFIRNVLDVLFQSMPPMPGWHRQFLRAKVANPFPALIFHRVARVACMRLIAPTHDQKSFKKWCVLPTCWSDRMWGLLEMRRRSACRMHADGKAFLGWRILERHTSLTNTAHNSVWRANSNKLQVNCIMQLVQTITQRTNGTKTAISGEKKLLH